VTLRDQLLLDRSVFFDAEGGFGEELVLTLDEENPVPVTVIAVRDDDLTTKRTQGPQELEGVFTSRTVLHLASGQITRPVEGQRLTLGAEASSQCWYVRRVSEAEGMLELLLERQET